MAESIQLVVLGGGPGGYGAAFYAADQGIEVTLIDERGELGGVCLHEGCIPSKFYLHVAALLEEAEKAREWGINFSRPEIDVEKLRAQKEKIRQTLTAGLKGLAAGRKIRIVQGHGRFVAPDRIGVESEGRRQEFQFRHAIVATGSRPRRLSLFPESKRIWTSREALEIPFVPEKLLVVGGGVIGLELGTVYQALGSRVTIVELLEHIAPGVDPELRTILEKELSRKFQNIHCATKVVHCEDDGQQCRVTLERGDERWEESFSAILLATGRVPNTDALALEEAQVKVDSQGFIVVDEGLRTQNPRVYAIGDVVRGPMLAHRATYQGRVAVEHLLGRASVWDVRAIPSVIYTQPEVAWVGWSETEAKEKNIPVAVAKFPWSHSGRQLTMGGGEGLTKIVAHRETGQVLGVAIVGPHAGELIGEGCLAVEIGALAEDVARSMHPHPTLSETVMETAEGLFGLPTHLLRRRSS